MSTPSQPEISADWISQAEAARIRGVSRQAIQKLVHKGRFRTLEIGGRIFVHREDASADRDDPATSVPDLELIKALLEQSSKTTRKAIFDWLRGQNKIHPLEDEFGVSAEVILEAIARSSDLSKRGIRGLITEASFKMNVLDKLGWVSDITPPGNHEFDFLIDASDSKVKIQVKMQRKKAGRPMLASEGYRSLDSRFYVVETQKTRAGVDSKSGRSTRPYRFSDFDILCVGMQPSTGNWSEFRYTVVRWLIPHPGHPNELLKFQPVSLQTNDDWTDDLKTCIRWWLGGSDRTIRGRV